MVTCLRKTKNDSLRIGEEEEVGIGAKVFRQDPVLLWVCPLPTESAASFDHSSGCSHRTHSGRWTVEVVTHISPWPFMPRGTYLWGALCYGQLIHESSLKYPRRNQSQSLLSPAPSPVSQPRHAQHHTSPCRHKLAQSPTQALSHGPLPSNATPNKNDKISVTTASVRVPIQPFPTVFISLCPPTPDLLFSGHRARPNHWNSWLLCVLY